MKKYTILFSAVMFLLCSALMADDNAQTKPSSRPTAVDMSDKQALTANMGNEVMVHGVVADAQWSKTGAVFLITFNEGQATQFQGAVLSKYRDAMQKSFNGDLAAAFKGATLQIDGKLQTYRQHPEILITDPKQITILVKGPGNTPASTQR